MPHYEKNNDQNSLRSQSVKPQKVILQEGSWIRIECTETGSSVEEQDEGTDIISLSGIKLSVTNSKDFMKSLETGEVLDGSKSGRTI